jgi:hypothetical protein
VILLVFQPFPQIFYLKDFTEATYKIVNNKTFSKPHVPLRTDYYIFNLTFIPSRCCVLPHSIKLA